MLFSFFLFVQTKKWSELDKLNKDQEVKFVNYMNGMYFPVYTVYCPYLYGFFCGHLKSIVTILVQYLKAGCLEIFCFPAFFYFFLYIN